MFEPRNASFGFRESFWSLTPPQIFFNLFQKDSGSQSAAWQQSLKSFLRTEYRRSMYDLRLRNVFFFFLSCLITVVEARRTGGGTNPNPAPTPMPTPRRAFASNNTYCNSLVARTTQKSASACEVCLSHGCDYCYNTKKLNVQLCYDGNNTKLELSQYGGCTSADWYYSYNWYNAEKVCSNANNSSPTCDLVCIICSVVATIVYCFCCAFSVYMCVKKREAQRNSGKDPGHIVGWVMRGGKAADMAGALVHPAADAPVAQATYAFAQPYSQQQQHQQHQQQQQFEYNYNHQQQQLQQPPLLQPMLDAHGNQVVDQLERPVYVGVNGAPFIMDAQQQQQQQYQQQQYQQQQYQQHQQQHQWQQQQQQQQHAQLPHAYEQLQMQQLN